MDRPRRLNKAQIRKFLEYLLIFEQAHITRPMTFLRLTERQRKRSAQIHRNVKHAVSIVRYYADPEKKLIDKPNFRKTKIHDKL